MAAGTVDTLVMPAGTRLITGEVTEKVELLVTIKRLWRQSFRRPTRDEMGEHLCRD